MNYLNNNELEQLKKIQIEMLKDFIKVCKKLNLRYFVIGGTLLGTIRHRGFIPWDDDIDIGMPREDYEIFINKAQKHLKQEYFLQNKITDFYYPNNFAKIRNCNTTFIEESVKHLKINHGVYIDIFPLDGVGNNKIDRFIFKVKNLIYSNRISQVFYSNYTENISYKNKILHKISKIIIPDIKKALINQEKLFIKFDYDSSEIITNYCGAWGYKEVMPKSYFGEGKILKFEGISVRVPIKYNEYLTKVYGDYKQLPPVEQRITHHNISKIDLDKSYLEYREDI